MKFTLKDYQDDAVAEVLDRLKKSHKRWHEDSDKHAFSLTATTGAGKTVMAAAVFEALFFGSDDYEFEADPGAVVIWFSDDPSLNEQSKYRLMEASDKLTVSDLITVENTFAGERFAPGRIYFLNTQKLSKSSLLVRGHDPADAGIETADGVPLMPDARAYTIWDTIKNTIEDPELTLYLVLDEAHRGMRDRVQGTQTIVTRLINGQGAVPGIPVVWGISATVERFNEAVKNMDGHASLVPVKVSSKLVQESGLLKDTINLDVPDETGDFTTVLLRRGTEKLKEITEAWEAYADQQDEADPVVPLMVLQVPNSPDHNEIGIWLETIFAAYPELPPDCVYNVLGERRTETFGAFSVPYIAPERVQESQWVRILIAKDAISTGWDCPRAEVMVSFRAATDRTHITQLLGRMVRTPLAMRIPGNDRLNSVDCLLPHFDQKSVEAVVTSLMTGEDVGDEPLGRRVLINPREFGPNPAIPEAVWERLESLPSMSLPKKQARPVKRLTALAHELAADSLLPNAGKTAHQRMHKMLDGALVTFDDEISAARKDVLTVEGKAVQVDVETKAMTFDDFVEVADYAVIEDAFKRAGRVLTPDLALTFSEHLAENSNDPEGDDALIEAHIVVAALGLIPDIKEQLETSAQKLAEQWLADHRVAIKGLNDLRQEAYRQISQMSAEPVSVDIVRPVTWLQNTRAKDPDGTEFDLPLFEKHLMSDGDGRFPEHFTSSWEEDVLSTELSRESTVGWYRNPARASQDSLGITYEMDGEQQIVRPDFIFFRETADGTIVADVVDPHGHHLSDALPKLRGLAEYAESNAQSFGRIEAVAKTGNGYRVLDLTEQSVRLAILAATSATLLFDSPHGSRYLLDG